MGLQLFFDERLAKICLKLETSEATIEGCVATFEFWPFRGDVLSKPLTDWSTKAAVLKRLGNSQRCHDWRPEKTVTVTDANRHNSLMLNKLEGNEGRKTSKPRLIIQVIILSHIYNSLFVFRYLMRHDDDA